MKNSRDCCSANPNYFGNLVESPFKVVLPISGNTYYEELACVGYHPQQRAAGGGGLHLPAVRLWHRCLRSGHHRIRSLLSVVRQRRHLAGPGHDQLPGLQHPARAQKERSAWNTRSRCLSAPTRKLCFLNPLIRVRAILSWNNPPPPNQPNWTPIWGNVRDASILVEPRRFIIPPDIFEVAKIKLPPHFSEISILKRPSPPRRKALGAVELSALYRDKGVPVHRFAYQRAFGLCVRPDDVERRSVPAPVIPGIAIDPWHRRCAVSQDGRRHQFRRTQVHRARSQHARSARRRDPGQETPPATRAGRAPTEATSMSPFGQISTVTAPSKPVSARPQSASMT